MDQWTNGPMVQWTNGPINQWSRGPMDHSLCHKGDFNPIWIVNVVLLINLSYVTLMCTLRRHEPKIFIEVFLRNYFSWWMNIYSFRLIHTSQFTCLLCTYTFLCYSYKIHNAIFKYIFVSAA